MATSPQSFSQAAENEARDFIRLLRFGESVVHIRNTIAADRTSPAHMAKYRREILLAFESRRIWRKAHAEISPELRLEIARLLRANLSLARVSQAVHVSGTRVWRIAHSMRASTWKHGRGHRFLPQQLEGIREAIKCGQSSAEICSQLNCCYEIVKRERIALGDTRNHHFDKKLSPLQVQEIRDWLAQPRGSRSMTWKQVAAKYGISIALIGFIKRHEYGY